jgi:hypothetical protein
MASPGGEAIQAGLENWNTSLDSKINKLRKLEGDGVDIGIMKAVEQEPGMTGDLGGSHEVRKSEIRNARDDGRGALPSRVFGGSTRVAIVRDLRERSLRDPRERFDCKVSFCDFAFFATVNNISPSINNTSLTINY